MLPALVVAAIGLDPSRTLVLSQVVLSFGIPFALVPLVWFTSRPEIMGTLVVSQVVLSFGIPFALVPLVWFTSRRELMGNLVNRKATTAVAAVVAALISALNLFLLGQTFGLA